MRLFIRGGEEQEWAMIELQGKLALDGSAGFDGLPLGRLTVNENKNAELIVGNHRLEGKRVALQKPLVVLLPAAAGQDALRAEDTEKDELHTSNRSYNTVGVIRYKYLFRNRPKPV
ncbi:Replication factor C complex [Balamuthia mandrillaris]